MNIRIKLAATMGVAACASATFAGFTVTTSYPVTAGGFDRYDIVAVNTGGDTGTQIKGLEYFYSGAPAAFEVQDLTDPGFGDPDGIPDTVNLLSASRTRIRVSTSGASNVFVGVSPDNGTVQPNPYLNGVGTFQGAIANTGVTQASGAGFQIARVFIPADSTGVFSGNIGGDVGAKVPFSVLLQKIIVDPFIVVEPVPDTSVVFGSVVSNGAPFSVTVRATGGFGPLVLQMGSLPAGVRDVIVTGGGPSPATWTVSGVVDYGLNGASVLVPFVVSDTQSGLTGNSSFRLNVTPEPGSLAVAVLAFMCRRRRATGKTLPISNSQDASRR